MLYRKGVINPPPGEFFSKTSSFKKTRVSAWSADTQVPRMASFVRASRSHDKTIATRRIPPMIVKVLFINTIFY
jgi:hypothetical protein